MPQPSQDNPSPPTNPPGIEPSGSPTPSPDDHLKTLIEFLKPGSVDLVRRWVAALLLAPEAERERIVQAVEARVAQLYALGDEAPSDAGEGPADEPLFHVADEPVEREGHVEQTIRTYSKAAEQALEQCKPAPEQAADQPSRRRKVAD